MIMPVGAVSNKDILFVRSLVLEVLAYAKNKDKLPFEYNLEIGDANPPEACSKSDVGEHLIAEMFHAPDGLGTLVCTRCGSRFQKKVGLVDFSHGKRYFREALKTK